MRLRLPLLPLVLATTFACQSTETPVTEDSTTPPAPAGNESETAVTVQASAAPMPVILATQVEGSQDLELRKQRRAELVKTYIENGEAQLGRADLEGALQSFASALEIDPSSETARERLRTVRGMLGEEYASAADAFADATDRAVVRRAQALLQADEFNNEGERQLEQGNYDSAIEQFQKAETILRWHPTIEDGDLNLRIMQGRIDTAIQLREEARAEEQRVAREEAEAEMARVEEAERERRKAKLAEYYDRANEAFLAQNYTNAEQWTQLILMEDPNNQMASSLLETARNARHAKAAADNRRDYREQWLRTFEDLDTMNVPQTDSLKFDLDRWAKVRDRKPLTEAGVAPLDRAEREAVLARLDEVRFRVSFLGEDGEGSPLEEVAAYLQSITGINFYISPSVIDELDEEETTINLDLPERSVRKVLEIISDTSENLRWKIEDGVVKFVTAFELTGGQVLKTYSVHDLINPIRDYPGTEINISPSGGIVPPDEDFEERESNVVNATLLEDLIRNNIAPQSWDDDPANALRITETGALVVNQVPDVHNQIDALLTDLREATGIMVDIQARFMKVEDNFLEDIGVDFRGLGSPGLGTSGNGFNDFGDASVLSGNGSAIGRDTSAGAFLDEGGDGDLRARVEQLYDTSLGRDNVLQGSGGLSFQWTFLNDIQLELILRAVSKSERIELVTAPRILVHNNSRANLSVLNQVAYVQDYDVEIAQGASIADPIVGVIQDGVVLDVRPVVSADRRFITLELRPTIAELQRPIRERVTTLGSQNSVTIQLPEVEIQRVRTTIPIPDRGTVLLGGTKVSEKQDLRSGVPLVNKIPLVSSLFERQGNFVSNRKLLILLRASVVIPEEQEPTPAETGSPLSEGGPAAE